MKHKNYFIVFISLLILCGIILKVFILNSNKIPSGVDSLSPMKEKHIEQEEKKTSDNIIEGSNLAQDEEDTYLQQEEMVNSGIESNFMTMATGDQTKIIPITQHMFTETDAEMIFLGALDDHGIANAVGFYDTFGEYFDVGDGTPSMFSCEDVDIEGLKQGVMGGKCRWYRIEYSPFSFVFMAQKPLLTVENGKIYIKDQLGRKDEKYEITQYNFTKDITFERVIKKSKDWLDKKYCLKKHYFGDVFKDGNVSWIAGLGEKLNKLYNKAKLKIYDIHEMVDGDCSNNNQGIVLYEEGSQKFYTVIGNNPGAPVMYYDGIYSTPFSIDIE